MGFPTTEFDPSFFALPLSCKYAISLAPILSSLCSILSVRSLSACQKTLSCHITLLQFGYLSRAQVVQFRQAHRKDYVECALSCGF